jgi:uncharacterized membrane protein YebE (DUF533 family)
MEKYGKHLAWLVVIAVIGFIAYTQFKEYLIGQVFKKGLLEDSPVNRQALENENAFTILQTMNTLKTATSFEQDFEMDELG